MARLDATKSKKSPRSTELSRLKAESRDATEQLDLAIVSLLKLRSSRPPQATFSA